MNPAKLRQRSNVIKRIREYFDTRGYMEMHTPRLVGLPGQEPYLEPFWAEVVTPDDARHPAALITSPEYAMKRLLVAGMDKIYDLGPCFRNNEPWDGTHDPEFLMLEWYRKDAHQNNPDQLSSRTPPAGGGGISSLMDETEEMVRFVAEGFDQTAHDPINVSPDTRVGARFIAPRPFRRVTCTDVWKQYANLDLPSLIGDRDAMAQAARNHGQTVADTDTWDDLYFKIFLSQIEPKLGEEPTFLHRYPASQAALAKTCADDPRFAERVELYIGEPAPHPRGKGRMPLELANGFVELADANEQRKRFEEEIALRKKLGKNTWPVDEKFLTDLPKMGEAVGIAFGVDRLVMLLTGAKSINDVIPFSARERFGH